MTEELIYVVDNDGAARRSLQIMLGILGYKVVAFISAEAFLSSIEMSPAGCILLELRLPGMDGLAAQSRLNDMGILLPVIFLSGHGDIPTAVRALRAGALSFLEKPFEKKALLEAIREGHSSIREAQAKEVRRVAAEARIYALTNREKDVLVRLAAGLPNKAIAQDLGISPRTVEIHRAHMMETLGARSLSDALKVAFAAGLDR